MAFKPMDGSFHVQIKLPSGLLNRFNVQGLSLWTCGVFPVFFFFFCIYEAYSVDLLSWTNSLTPTPPLFQLTSTATDPSLGFTILSCFVSPHSDPSVVSDYTLIETVCPKDDSVVLHPQRDFPAGGGGRRKTFSFNFNSKFNKSLLFLHCEMSLCSKRSHGSQSLPPVRSSFYSCLGFFFLPVFFFLFFS